jgi:hypothetical protein
MRNRIVLTIYLATFVAISLIFVWPIYQDAYLFVTIGMALAFGSTIGILQAVRKWSVLNTVLLILAVYLIFAVPATNPLALRSPEAFIAGWLDSLSASVFSWKQLVTIELPVGTYHSLLVPMFIAYLLASAVLAWVIFSPVRLYWIAIIPLLTLSVFAISFGETTVPGDLNLLGLLLPIPTALVLGFALLILAIAYLSWGASAARRSKLLGTSDKNVFSVGSSGRIRQARKLLSALLVISLTSGIASTFMISEGVAVTRAVIRSAVDPMVIIRNQISPLSTYRMYFTNPELLDKELIVVDQSEGGPDRIRLSVMPYYDGTSFTVTPTLKQPEGSAMFARVPADLASRTGFTQTTVTNVKVRELDSIWLPLVTNVKRVAFVGASQSENTDAFFLNRATFSGAVIPNGSSGAEYQIVSYQAETVDPSQLTPSSSNIDKSFIPESLTEWLKQQTDIDVSTADGLAKLAKRLRERGYLSHALQRSSTDNENLWMTRLPGYSFESSLGGHNMGRIGKMFTALNERASASKTTTDRFLVSAIGDDEQFATAIALIAAANNYPARVVVGFRTTAGPDQPKAVPVCEGGSCKGENLTAWVEVQGENGQWAAIEATPQFENKVSPKSTKRQDPKNPTSVVEDSANVLPPAMANPATGDTPPPDIKTTIDLAWLVQLLARIFGYTLTGALLLSPFVLILFMKRKRRREREESESPTDKVQGAWEEFVDQMVDFGYPLPKTQTRLELIGDYERPSAIRLAELSDMAAFSFEDPSPDEVEEAWALLGTEVQELKRLAKPKKLVMAKLSLRSFIRHVNTEEQIAKLRGAINFSQSGEKYEGSPIVAFGKFVWRQLSTLVPKKYHLAKGRKSE